MNRVNHSFVVPAYGHSAHLEECLSSLAAQNLASEIVVSTSTPHDGLDALCAEYGAQLYVHGPNKGIANDWNIALAQANGRLVTIAHQDDIYFPDFSAEVVGAMGAVRCPVLSFTDYREMDESGFRPFSRLLAIKRILLEAGFLGRRSVSSSFAKRNVLRFACPIPCPAVTLNTEAYRDGFDVNYQVNLDWATWLNAASALGSFVWIRRPLMAHRIHVGSETSAAINDGRRRSEDLRILRQLWPNVIADIIGRTYAIAYSSNS